MNVIDVGRGEKHYCNTTLISIIVEVLKKTDVSVKLPLFQRLSLAPVRTNCFRVHNCREAPKFLSELPSSQNLSPRRDNVLCCPYLLFPILALANDINIIHRIALAFGGCRSHTPEDQTFRASRGFLELSISFLPYSASVQLSVYASLLDHDQLTLLHVIRVKSSCPEWPQSPASIR